MWKKLLISLLALFGTFSVVYALNNQINANSSTYQSGGAIDGRINIAPNGLVNGGNIGLQKGDRVLLGALNPSDSSPLSWLLLGREIIWDSANNTEKVNADHWVTMSTKSIGKEQILPAKSSTQLNVPATEFTFVSGRAGTFGYRPFINDTDANGGNAVARFMSTFNATFTSQDQKVIAERDKTRNEENKQRAHADGRPYIFNQMDDLLSSNALSDEYGKKAYLYEVYELYAPSGDIYANVPVYEGFSTSVMKKDFRFSEDYILRTSYDIKGVKPTDVNHLTRRDIEGDTGWFNSTKALDGFVKQNIRPALTQDFSNVVFAVSKGTVNGLGTVTEPMLSPSYTDLYTDTLSHKDLKLRIQDPTMYVDLKDIRNGSKLSISSIGNGASLHIYAEANSINDSTLSVLLFKDGKFIYYRPLEKVNTMNDYVFDTTGIANGDYQIAVVNEVYDDTTNEPANCSAISGVMNISVVDTLTNLTFTAKDDLVYNNVNVNTGADVGTISSQGGVADVTYTLLADANSPTDVTHFEIAADGKTVIVKGNALEAGTYTFKIQAQDANGDPSIPLETTAVIEVEKADPEITFDEDDHAITYLNSKIADTITHSEHATHKNTDIADEDVSITYSQTTGSLAIIKSGLPFTAQTAGDKAELTIHKNVGGNITIQATVGETENFKKGTTTKTLAVQLELQATYSNDKVNIIAGSADAKPPVALTQANRIGHMNAKGGTSPYTYELASGVENNDFFQIDTDGNVYIRDTIGSTGLLPGTYTISVTVEDSTSPTKQTVNVKGTIVVQSADVSGIGWEDPDQANTAIQGDTITRVYDPLTQGGSFTTKLIEVDAGALTGTSIAYTLEADPNDVIAIVENGDDVNVTIKNASTTGNKDKVKIIAHITGGNYGSTGVTTEIKVNIDPYKQTIAFKDTSILKLPVGGSCVSVNADITSKYSIPGGSILYSMVPSSGTIPFSINSKGEVCPTTDPLQAGTAQLSGTLKGNDNYTKAITPTNKTIQIYVPGGIEVTGSIKDGGTSGVTYTPDTLLKANDKASNENGTAKINEKAAKLQIDGSAPADCTKSTNNGAANADAGLFQVASTGYISLSQSIYAADIAGHATGNDYYLQVDVTDDSGYTKTIDVIIVIENADADFYFVDPVSASKLPLDHVYSDATTKVSYYTAVYEPNGSIEVATNLASEFYEDVTGDQDVIEHTTGGSFTIVNASDAKGVYGTGGNTYIKACMKKKAGYTEACIYAQVEISRADQSDFAFVKSPIWNSDNTVKIITPLYNHKKTTGDVVLITSDDQIAEVQPYLSGYDQSFKIMGKLGRATLTATAPEDRNYNVATATTELVISDQPQTTLVLQVDPMTYGDTGKKAVITSGYKQGVPAYFYVDDTSILSINNQAVDQNDSPAITALKQGQVTVKVCQINQPFDPSVDDCNALGGDYGEATITVKRKPITFVYKDEVIFSNQDFPDYSFLSNPITDFAFQDGMADFPIPVNTSAKENGIALLDTNKAGLYAITGSYSDSEKNEVMKNYDITIKEGKLTILQDLSDPTWYHLEDPYGNEVSENAWHNYYVDVVLDSAVGNAGIYDQIADTPYFTNPDATRFTVTKEDEIMQDVYFRIDPNSSAPNKGTVSEKAQTPIKIDLSDPVVDSITGYPVNTSGLSELLNQITLGHFFKPGVEIIIHAEDPQPAGNVQPVTVSEVATIAYKVYELDTNGILLQAPPIMDLQNTPDANGNLNLRLYTVGNYRVCATAIDNAGNIGEEACSDLNIHKLDIDVDGDGKPDFNDPDNNLCPDLNIKWKDPNDASKWIIINGDRDYDGIPDLNIDSNGDGIADLNIDSDGDGIPDLNLGSLRKEDWEVKYCVLKDITKGIMEEYCTGTNAKPSINVDINGDGIPDINIDNNGDMKPDINISKDGKTPSINIVKIDSWNPSANYDKDGFLYDSIGTGKTDPKPVTNIDTNGDGYPDVNIDFNGDGIPEINIDVDGDGIPDVDIDGDGDGIPDYNLDPDEDGNPTKNVITIKDWTPEKIDCKKDGVDFGTMELQGTSILEDNNIQIEHESGKFLPNSAIKVNDITSQLDDGTKEKIKEQAGEQELKKTYDIKYLENDTEQQPDGSVKVKIPIDPNIKNPVILVENEKGEFEKVKATEKDGYYVFDTDYLGKVSVIGDVEQEPEPTPDPSDDSTTDLSKDPAATPSTSVKGNYVKDAQAGINGMGGANTGDTANPLLYIGICSFACYIFVLSIHKRRKQK